MMYPVKKHDRAIFGIFLVPLIALVLFSGNITFAHDGIHEQIVATSKKIKKQPKNPALYLKRAELYRLHKEWKKSQRDYRRAEKLDPQLSVVDLGRGKLWYAAGQFSKAKRFLERFLVREPESFEGFITLARVLNKLGEKEDAVRYFSRAISVSPADSVELFLERAEILVADKNPDAALRGLDEGIRQFGQLLTLQNMAIKIELEKKDYDAAIKRLDQLSAVMKRKETFLLQRGEILLRAGKHCAARQSFLQSLAGFKSLPPARRNVRAIRGNIQKLENYLSAAPPAKNCE